MCKKYCLIFYSKTLIQKMSKEFKIEYHGSGTCFWDGTRLLISKYKSNLEKEMLYQKDTLKNIKTQFTQRIY